MNKKIIYFYTSLIISIIILICILLLFISNNNNKIQQSKIDKLQIEILELQVIVGAVGNTLDNKVNRDEFIILENQIKGLKN